MSPQLKKELAEYLNKKINLPLLTEAQEQVLFDLVLELVASLIPSLLARGLLRDH